MTLNYVYLLIAVAFEVTATMALKSTDGFTRLWPSLISIAGYALAAYFLSLLVRTIQLGIVYALWCGLGISFSRRRRVDFLSTGAGPTGRSWAWPDRCGRRNHQFVLEKHPALEAEAGR